MGRLAAILAALGVLAASAALLGLRQSDRAMQRTIAGVSTADFVLALGAVGLSVGLGVRLRRVAKADVENAEADRHRAS